MLLQRAVLDCKQLRSVVHVCTIFLREHIKVITMSDYDPKLQLYVFQYFVSISLLINQFKSHHTLKHLGLVITSQGVYQLLVSLTNKQVTYYHHQREVFLLILVGSN